MTRLILLRHGQSEWNLKNLFTGWTDVDLTDQGREEARQAGLKIKQAGIEPQYYFTSYLKRAIHTLHIAASAMDRDWVPEVKDWHLNERHYGALQGLNKADTRYRDPTPDELPDAESLELTIRRVQCVWEEKIIPALRHYGDVLVAAHGNSLRGLAMMLRKLSPQEVVSLEIPTGQPWVFELDDNLTPIREYFL